MEESAPKARVVVVTPFDAERIRALRAQAWKSFFRILLPSGVLAWMFVVGLLAYVGIRYQKKSIEERIVAFFDVVSTNLPIFGAEQSWQVVGGLIAITAALLAALAAGYIAIAFSGESVIELRRRLSRWSIGICVVWLPGATLVMVFLVVLRGFVELMLTLPLILALLWLACHIGEFGEPTLEQNQVALARALEAASEKVVVAQKKIDRIRTLRFSKQRNSKYAALWSDKPSALAPLWRRELLLAWEICWRSGVLTAAPVLLMGINWELFGWGGFVIFFQIFSQLWWVTWVILTACFSLARLFPRADDLQGVFVIIILYSLHIAMIVVVGDLVTRFAYRCASGVGCEPIVPGDPGYWLPFWVFVLSAIVLLTGSWRRLGWKAMREQALRERQRLERSLDRLEKQRQLKIHEAVKTLLAASRRSTKADLLECIARKLPSSLNYVQVNARANEVFQDLLQNGDIVLIPGVKGWSRRGPSFYQRGEAK